MGGSRALALGWPLIAGQLTAFVPGPQTPLAISGADGTAKVGDTTPFTPSIVGGTAPYNVTATGMPAGRTITDATTGLTSGTYTTAGTYSTTYTVTDSKGATATFTRSDVVSAASNFYATQFFPLAA